MVQGNKIVHTANQQKRLMLSVLTARGICGPQKDAEEVGWEWGDGVGVGGVCIITVNLFFFFTCDSMIKVFTLHSENRDMSFD